MELKDFPRPPQDNGRGVHWSLSVYEWGKRNWSFWAEQISAMQLKWVKIMDDGGGSGLRLARQLVELGVMPVVRLYWPEQNPGNIGQRGRETVRRYVQAGAMYFETNNEPDLDLEWKGTKPPNWLDIVVDNFIIDADIVLEEGGYPAVPAFGVGTLRDPFAKIVARGRRDILDGGAWAALHNYCLARPLEYPNDPVNTQGVPITEAEWQAAGGMWAWEMSWTDVNRARQRLANPNAHITTDATCFRAFEYVNMLVVQAVGHSIPILTTEGGYNVGQRAGTTFGDDPRYPKPTPMAASQLNLDMFRFMQGERTILGRPVPPYYFAVMPWLIAAYRIGVWTAPAENQGPWFTHQFDQQFGLKGELPLVQMLKDLPSRVRQDGPVPKQWTKPPWHQELGKRWDCRLNVLGVTVEGDPPDSGRYWKLIEARWLDEEEATGSSHIFVRALDEQGQYLENATFVVTRPGGRDQAATKGSIDGYWGNYPMYATLGTYRVHMAHGGYASQVVAGLGLGLEDNPKLWTRTSFRLTFQLVSVSGTPPAPPAPTPPAPPTPTPPAPTPPAPTPPAPTPPAPTPPAPTPPTPPAPPSGEDVKKRLLEQAILQAARARIIPLNPNAPLYRYAREHNLGERLSVEFMILHAGVPYTAQAFERAVVYAPTGRWDQIDHVPRSS